MNGENSEWLEVTSSVPQGSVLGPLLFILYINDIVEVIQCDLEFFADDTIIETIHDIVKLQQDLDNLQDWSRPLLLNLNFDKCKVRHIGKTQHSNYHVSDITPPGVFANLHDVSYEKDLGVWTTNKMESSLHCQKAVSNANRILGMVRRTFASMSRDLFMFLYKTCICEATFRILCLAVVPCLPD